ncbi:uncharacterized protein RNJ42_00648 [Nakaseomyces bracarensis]|uniref:uncharacterized protein n=1 Tax=Nakaseomyces bracarensis TaxID=273131 RepID=UPI003871C57D
MAGPGDVEGHEGYADSIELNDLDIEEGGDMYVDEPDSRPNEQWMMLQRSNPLSRLLRRIWDGPDEPRDDPPSFVRKWRLFQVIDDIPNDIFKFYFQNSLVRTFILAFYCLFWLALLYQLLNPYLIKPPYFSTSDGQHRVPIQSLSCNSYLNWAGHNNECGLNARECGPFEDKEYIVRCPALCDRGGWTYSAIAVGDRRVKYTGYEIGGGELHDPNDPETLSYPYRSDSFVCGAAVHAGIVSPFSGGCARVKMTGSQLSFPSRRGKYRTGFSVAMDSFFPGSYTFKDIKDGIASGCYDPRTAVVVSNILIGLPVFYFYDSLVGYWVINIVGYWTLTLALDPPLLTDPHDPASVYELISVGFQRLLPLCFILYVLWKAAVKRTLEDGSPLAKMLLWYPTFWLGVMNNVTFDRLPVDRLTAKDLKEQAGAMTAVGSIFATILTCAVIQAYSLWKSGRFQKYFKIYITFIGGLIFLSTLSGLNLRIHHYILGMLLVPGCATRGASAYLFQGILLGLVLSGVARWDFASIVETNVALLRGEAGGRLPPPVFTYTPEKAHLVSWKLNNNSTETVTPLGTVDVVDPTGNIDGYSLLLNDIEVYVGNETSVDLDKLIDNNTQLNSLIEQSLASNDTVKLYLRVARASTRAPAKNRGDYTNAAILEWPLSSWTDPLPGIS